MVKNFNELDQQRTLKIEQLNRLNENIKQIENLKYKITDNPEALEQVMAAIATSNIDHANAVVAGLVNPAQPEEDYSEEE